MKISYAGIPTGLSEKLVEDMSETELRNALIIMGGKGDMKYRGLTYPEWMIVFQAELLKLKYNPNVGNEFIPDEDTIQCAHCNRYFHDDDIQTHIKQCPENVNNMP